MISKAALPAERRSRVGQDARRFAGSKDRAAVRDHVFQALRCLRSYACLGGAATGRGVMIGALRAAGRSCRDVHGSRVCAIAADGSENRMRVSIRRDAGDRMDLPDWIIPDFISALGGEAEANRVAHLLQQRAPVMLRVNAAKGVGRAGRCRAVGGDGRHRCSQLHRDACADRHRRCPACGVFCSISRWPC